MTSRAQAEYLYDAWRPGPLLIPACLRQPDAKHGHYKDPELGDSTNQTGMPLFQARGYYDEEQGRFLC